MATKTVMVLGAGLSGICAARRAIENGLSVTVFEKADQLGGLWYCKDDLSHVCMYDELRSNQPRQIMELPEYYFARQDEWYFSAKEVQDYLIGYAETFGVDKVVKFQKEVLEVRPTNIDGKDSWEVTIKDLLTNEKEIANFDFVAICNGHHSDPQMVVIKGQQVFKGEQLHSVKYRKAEKFKGKRVLVIGSGVSAMDISMLLTKECTNVYFSQRTSFALDFEKPANLKICTVVKEITETGVIFEDDTTCDVDAIIYATGYVYSFPFLNKYCGIVVEDNHIQDLYKHCLNIKHPSMALIGMPIIVLAQQLFDLQSQLCMKYWAGAIQLPSQEEMLRETNDDWEKRLALGWQKRQAHKLVRVARDYHNDLADTAAVPRTKNVLHNIADYFIPATMGNYLHYRDECYEVLDDEKFRTYWK